MRNVIGLILTVALVLVVSCSAWASTSPVPEFDLIAVLQSLLGDKATYVVVFVSVVGYTWAQVRQLISAEKLAKLPGWVIWLLELLAANKGKAANSPNNDPSEKKRWGG